MIAPYIEETINHCNKLVQEAGIRWSDVSRIVLVGNSCHIPYVKWKLQQDLQRPITQVRDLGMAACQGAAIHGVQLEGNSSNLISLVANIFKSFTDLFIIENEEKVNIVEVLTYKAAIEYFVINRPNDLRIQKGAMLLKPHPQGTIFIQVFLDKDNNPVCMPDGKPYGRQILVRQLDTELRNAFGSKQLIIVE